MLRLCESRGCIWNTTITHSNEPFCYYPPDYGYTFISQYPKPYGMQYIIQQKSKYPNPYGQDIPNVTVDLIYDTNQRIRIRMTDSANQHRYEPSINLPPIPSTKASNPLYLITASNTNDIFGFDIKYGSSSFPTITTALPGFSYSNQFIQLILGFASGYSAFGWGEFSNT